MHICICRVLGTRASDSQGCQQLSVRAVWLVFNPEVLFWYTFALFRQALDCRRPFGQRESLPFVSDLFLPSLPLSFFLPDFLFCALKDPR